VKKALITGITGQDGAYLAKYLLEKGYEVFGTIRRVSTPNFWRLQALDIFDKVTLIPADLIDTGSLIEALKKSEPDEVYNLAAQSFIATAFEEPIQNAEVTALGVTRILEAIRFFNPSIKFYQASTSEIFGNTPFKIQNEETPFVPASPYATAKLYGHWITVLYRQGYGMFSCSGILFNHESPLRGIEFVTRKISNAVAKISLGLDKEILLGNLDAERDWGYAPDYVRAMHLMMQTKEASDFVIATGESHSVREFAQVAFDVVGLDWQEHVKVDKRFIRPHDVMHLQGDYSKAKKILGWKPAVSFKKLVEIMVKEDLNRWQHWLDGKPVICDAYNYPHENRVLFRKATK